MKLRRAFSVVLLFVFLLNAILPVPPVKAQSTPLFEGAIAYINSTGNIMLVQGDGSQIQITQDGRLRTNENDNNYIKYNCLEFSPDGKYLYFDRFASFESESKEILYDTQSGTFSDLFDGNSVSITGCGLRWLKDKYYSFISAELKEIKLNPAGDTDLYNEKVYRQYISGEKELLFEVVTKGIGFSHGEFINEQSNTVIYKGENKQALVVLNWETGATNQIDLSSEYGWSPDSLSPDGNLFIIYPEDGSDKVIVVNIQNGQIYSWKNQGSLSWSPDSKQLLAVSRDYTEASPPTKVMMIDPFGGTATPAFEFNNDEELAGVVADWSPNGKYISLRTDRLVESENQYVVEPVALLLSENLDEPVSIDTSVEESFWLSGKNEKLLYIKINPIENNDFSREIYLYDPQKGDSVKIGGLPSKNALFVPGNGGLSEVAWTDGEVDLSSTPGTVPLVTMTPDANVTLIPQAITPSVNVACPFEVVFQEKEGVINSLLSPPQLSSLETSITIPLAFLDPPKWLYEEDGAKNLLASLRMECQSYANDTMSPEQKAEFERKIMAFKRLTYTEIALNGIYPQFLTTAYETSGSIADFLLGFWHTLKQIGEVGDWISGNYPGRADLVDDFFYGVQNFLLELLDSFLNNVIARMENFSKLTQFTFRPILQMVQFYVNLYWDKEEGAVDIFKEAVVQKLIAGHFLAKYVTCTQPVINIAVANVPPGGNANLPYLSMTGTDLEAEQAIDSLLNKSTQSTEQAISTIETWNKGAENAKIVSSVSQLSSTGLLIISPATGPGASATVSIAIYLKKLSAVMKALSTAAHGMAGGTGLIHLNQLHSYAGNSADIAFDPSKLNTVLAQENQIVNLDVASLDFVPANYIPASVYYTRFQTQTVISVDGYKASIERLMQAIAGGQDEQIRLAAEELLRVDEELRASLKIAEAPLNDMPFDRPEVQNLDFSVQDLRAQSVTLHVALMAYMVERTSPEIQQETQTIVSDVLVSADNFKMSYETLSQSGLAIPSKFLPVILDVKTPETIVQGDTFSLTVKILNVGQMSQQSPVTLSVAGGDKVSFSANQPLPEIVSGSQVEIPVNLTAAKSGNEIVVAEIVQDGSVIASKVVWLEIGKPDNIFAIIPTQYLLVGGLGLLCLGAFAIGGVFLFTRSRKPKRASSKIIKSQLSQTPISSSTEQIKHAIQLAKSNRLQEAFDILREVVKSEPNNAGAWFNLGSVLVHMENYRDTERCYSRAKHLGHPRADEALNSLKQKR